MATPTPEALTQDDVELLTSAALVMEEAGLADTAAGFVDLARRVAEALVVRPHTAHVTMEDGTVRRVTIDHAPSVRHGAAIAMQAFGGQARAANCWPAERRVRTTDCRVSITTPVKHSDSEFAALLA